MEDTFVIRGGVPLYGTVAVSGSKNAALPLLFASLITHGVSEFSGVPAIGDVEVVLRLLRAFGAGIEHIPPDTVRIDTRHLSYASPDPALVGKIRASTYLLGAMLSRFGRAEILSFGGCAFCARPIDYHLKAIRALGGTVGDREITASRLRGGRISFSQISVGATVNALLLAASAEGESVIENPATEPHILALIDYLNAAGGEITVCDGAFTVVGRPLHGAAARVIPDMIEAGTYLLCAPVTGGDVCVTGISPEQLTAFLTVLRESGVSVSASEKGIRVWGRPHTPMRVVAAPYPAFPTDLQPLIAVAAALGDGGIVADRVFPDRFSYLQALAPFGLCFRPAPGFAFLYPSRLRAAETRAPDLRGGAAALLCALACEGESRITGANLLLRGYASLPEKCRALGADVTLYS